MTGYELSNKYLVQVSIDQYGISNVVGVNHKHEDHAVKHAGHHGLEDEAERHQSSRHKRP